MSTCHVMLLSLYFLAALKRMLNLNAVPTKASVAEPVWKVNAV